MAQATFQYVNTSGSGQLQLQLLTTGLPTGSLAFNFDFSFDSPAVTFDRIVFGGTASSSLATSVSGSRVSIAVTGTVLPSDSGALATLYFNKAAAGVLDVDVSRLAFQDAAATFSDPAPLSLQAPVTPLPVFGLVETTLPEDAVFGWVPSVANGDPLTFPTVSAVPAHGELTKSAGSAWNYRPPLNYVGTDAFQLEGVNPTTLEVQRVTYRLTMTAVNDPPVFAERSVVLNLADASTPLVYTARATDVEDSATLVYALSGPDALGFAVSPATGELSLAPGRSLVQGVDYVLAVAARDPTGLTDTQQVLVRVGIPGTRIVSGTSADNLFVAQAGNDRVDGGNGTDTMSYTQARTALQVGRVDGSLRVVGPDSVDVLNSIEILRFADQSVGVVAPPTETSPAYGADNRFLFDPTYYLLANWDLVPALTMAGASDHFFASGGAEGRQPASWFNAQFYAHRYPDLAAYAGAPALLFAHYNLFGVWEGRAANVALQSFDGTRYLADNPDVAQYVQANLADFRGSTDNGAIAHFVI
ncbi:MAG: cadherin repeat domain-containing protein, partial [Burkholderiaceae bacterium]|nr:cadherin repeat domain-containing protein [Burkholderiaceae bacterium]